MKIMAQFDVDEKGNDLEKVAQAFDVYLRDMLYVGADDEDDDPFSVQEVAITGYMGQV